jgi:hypothetical protein
MVALQLRQFSRVAMAAVLALAAATAPTLSAAADEGPRIGPRWIARADLEAMMLGKRMAGTYMNGAPWKEIIHPGGKADYWENGKFKAGQWWFDAEDFLCFHYPETGGGGCFRYIRLSENCLEHFYRGGTPESDSAEERPDRPTGFVTNGKLWNEERPSTCKETPTS